MKRLLFIILLCCSLRAQQTDPYRLSQSLHPEFQFIHLDLNPDQEGYTGSTRIEMQITNHLDSLNLHGIGFSIDLIKVKMDDKPLQSHFKFNAHGILTLYTKDGWLPGSYVLEFKYKGVFNKKGEGIVKYEKDGFNYIYTQMEDIYARQFFPCLDEPGFKFPYQIEITAPEKDLVFSNTPEEKTELNGTFKTILFKKTKPLPVYLIAFAIGPYETEPIPGLSVPGRIILPKGYSGNSAYAKSITAKIVKGLESYFGIAYPYRKLDLISASDYNFGAMENPGLVVFAESYLIEADTLSLTKKYSVANVIAHELAHMWFGDLVTMKWWNDSWLNEGFATWIADEIVLQEFPQLNSMGAMYDNFKLSVPKDIDETSPPIVREVGGSDSPFTVFDNLTYEKSQVVLRMLEKWLGRDTFLQGLKIYFDNYSWKNSTSADLFNSLASVTKKPVKQMLQDFIMQAGVPLVTVRIDGNKIILAQQRFKSVESDTSYQTRWIIPLNLKISDGKKLYHKQVVLDKLKAEFVFDDIARIDWLHLKDDVTGYYLMLLPFDITVKALNSGQLTQTEIQDIFTGIKYGWQAGKVNPVEILKLAYTFRDTENKDLIIGLSDPLRNIVGMLSHSISPDIYEPFMNATVLPMLQKIGYGVDLSRTSAESDAQSDLIGCVDTEPEVLKKIKNLAAGYFEQSEISREYMTHFSKLCYYGDSLLYQKVLQRIEKSKDPEERSTLILSLGFFPTQFINKTLDYALTADLQPIERLLIPLYITFTLDFEKYKLGIQPQINILEWFKKHENFYKQKVAADLLDRFLPICIRDIEDLNTFDQLFPLAERSKSMQKGFNNASTAVKRQQKLNMLFANETKAYYDDFK